MLHGKTLVSSTTTLLRKNSSIKIRDFGCVLPVSCSKYVDYLRDMDNTYSVANFGYKILFIDGPKDRGYRTTLFKVLSRDDSYTKSLNMEDWCKDFSYQNYGDQISNVSSEGGRHFGVVFIFLSILTWDSLTSTHQRQR